MMELKKNVVKHLLATSNYHDSVKQGHEIVDNYIKTQKNRYNEE